MSGWPMSQKLSLLARFFFRSSVSRSAFICTLSSVTPGQSRLVDVLGRLGIELKGGEDDDLRLRHKRLRLLDRQLDLPLLQRRCSGPKEITTRCGLP